MSAAAAAAALAAAISVLSGGASLRHMAMRRGSLPLRRRLSKASSPEPALRSNRRAGHAPSWFDRRVNEVGFGVPADVVWIRWLLGCVALALGGAFFGGPVVAIAGATLFASLPFVVPRAVRGRRVRQIDAQLPSMLDAIGSGLRSGGSLHQAILDAAPASAPPLSRELQLVVRATQVGSSLAEALDAWGDRSNSSAVRMAVAVLVLGLRDGGARGAAVDGVGATIRDRLAVVGEARALSSQARASAVVIVCAPVVFAIVTALVDRAVLDFVGSPAGAACLVVGIGLDVAGALWMGRIMQGAT